MLTAPFVKSMDRANKDLSDMSMSDFAPKRFALKYEPIPMIGKLETISVMKLYLINDPNFSMSVFSPGVFGAIDRQTVPS